MQTETGAIVTTEAVEQKRSTQQKGLLRAASAVTEPDVRAYIQGQRNVGGGGTLRVTIRKAQAPWSREDLKAGPAVPQAGRGARPRYARLSYTEQCWEECDASPGKYLVKPAGTPGRP